MKKTAIIDFTQTDNPSNPTPTLALPLKGREIIRFLPLQGGGWEGDGVCAGVALNSPCRKIKGTLKISAEAGTFCPFLKNFSWHPEAPG